MITKTVNGKQFVSQCIVCGARREWDFAPTAIESDLPHYHTEENKVYYVSGNYRVPMMIAA
jgi:hypothetical protein